jgi:fucose permease
VAVGYSGTPLVSIPAAFLMGSLGTAALIRVWAVLADAHKSRRAVAMTEGEVTVSLAGVTTPLLFGVLADTALGWRFAFVLGAGVSLLAAVWVSRAWVPAAAALDEADRVPEALRDGLQARRQGLPPTLVIVAAIVALEFTLSFWLASYLEDEVDLRRNAAVSAVSGLYLANLVGRLAASRLARRVTADRLLALALAVASVGIPGLLVAGGGVLAGIGIALTGMGIGAMFPLTSAMHVEASPRGADGALGQVLAVAAIGQVVGPLVAGAAAQVAGLRVGLLVLPAATLVAAVSLQRHRSAMPEAREGRFG